MRDTFECEKCRGTGMEDSGGVQPWGEAVSVPCDCTQPDERAAFEAWMKKSFHRIKVTWQPGIGAYAEEQTEWLWTTWQARSAAPQASLTDDRAAFYRKALYQIAYWPDGGNNSGQNKIQKFALSILDGEPAPQASLTDSQILDLAEDFKSSSMSCGVPVDYFDSIGFARALLAKGD